MGTVYKKKKNSSPKPYNKFELKKITHS